jgi:2-phospho-L-lactate/phosphoenolpyruvate guanylyltransferase
MPQLVMAPIVVPFRGESAKQRLDASDEIRSTLALAMLGDVLTACVAAGHTFLVTDDADARALASELGGEFVDDPGGGQGPAVAAALERVQDGPVVVLNADVPCVVPHDLRTLAGVAELGALGLVEAEDGTTNALAFPRASLFAPLYGGGSAARFRDHLQQLGVTAVSAVIPNLSDDVDTVADLERVLLRAGPRTQAAIGTSPKL